jgi:hypothetical protein
MTIHADAVPATAERDRPNPSADLAARLGRLRTSASSGGLDRFLLVAGGILMPLGVLLIVLGWIGASHTVLLFEQIPYLISGGVLGLSVVFAGGFIYFAYWQTLRVRESRSHDRELQQSLRRIEDLLARALSEGGVAATRTAPQAGPAGPATGRGRSGTPAPSAPVAPAATHLATATGTMYHRPDCPVVVGRENLREVAAGAAGFEPCKICRPDD